MSRRTPRQLVRALALTITLASATPAIAVAQSSAVHSDTQSWVVATRPGVDPALLAASFHVKPDHVLRGAFNGFSARLNNDQVAEFRQKVDTVLTVSPNKKLRGATTQSAAPWGLDRIDQRRRPYDRRYNYARTGSTVRAYVIDSGIESSHPEFEGRAFNVFDASGGTGQDCNGHGTHVAGIIGSKTYGVAKRINLRGVRVATDCASLDVDLDDLLAGINYVYNYGVAPAVVNISIAGEFFDLGINNAVTALVNRGFFTAVAAGNNSEDSCLTSPASAIGVVTVAASDSLDQAAEWSGHGWCTEVYAPGTYIRSTYKGGAVRTESGSSMATPFVTGTAALVRETFAYNNPNDISSWITSNATSGILANVPWGTPNLLLHKGSL